MKLLIVGLGSMGKRRARLSKGIDAALHIVGVDTAEARRAEACTWAWRTQPYPPSARPSPPSTRTPLWFAPRRWPTQRSSANCWITTCLSLPS